MFKLSGLGRAYLTVICTAQAVERERAAGRLERLRAEVAQMSVGQPHRGHHRVSLDDGSMPIHQHGLKPSKAALEQEIQDLEKALAVRPMTEEAIVMLAQERGLAELVHLCTMPAARSTKVPLGEPGWHGPTFELDPVTGAQSALEAVASHRPGNIDEVAREGSALAAGNKEPL